MSQIFEMFYFSSVCTVTVCVLFHTFTQLCLQIVEADEIRRLSRSFKRLDLNQNGSLSADEFLSIPELQQNPLVRRVIDILDTDRNGEVDFQGASRSNDTNRSFGGLEETRVSSLGGFFVIHKILQG